MKPAPLPDSSRPSLDDLLRFKRTERPPPEFWTEFERGLREKQLSALLRQPQGWARLRPVFVRGLQWSTPVAAAVAVVFLFVHSSGNQKPVVVGEPVAIAPRPEIAAQPAAVQSEVQPSRLATLVATVEPAPTSVVASTPSNTEASETSVVAQREPAARPIALAALPNRAERVLPWSEASLGVSAAQPQLLRSFVKTARASANGERRASSWRNSQASQAAIPTWDEEESRLVQLTALDLRVTSEYAANLPSTPRGRTLPAPDRWASGRDDSEFRDSVTRIGVTGNSLSIKF